MTFNMCTMLYVQDVKAEANFFQSIGFAEISRETIAESETVTFAPQAEGNARLQIFDIEFIKLMSPEVADNKPSILFTVSDILKWHDNVKTQGGFISDLQDMGGKYTFNFQSPSGSYFAFMEA